MVRVPATTISPPLLITISRNPLIIITGPRSATAIVSGRSVSIGGTIGGKEAGIGDDIVVGIQTRIDLEGRIAIILHTPAIHRVGVVKTP